MATIFGPLSGYLFSGTVTFVFNGDTVPANTAYAVFSSVSSPGIDTVFAYTPGQTITSNGYALIFTVPNDINDL